MDNLKIIAEGRGECFKVDPDGYREWVRERKSRALVPKLMSEKEAVSKFVADGDYLWFECNYLTRGPAALVRELIRQQKKDLWVGAKFSWVIATMLVAGGCATKLDVGYFLFGPTVGKYMREGKLKCFEYSNVVMTNRIMAGAMGIPFLPIRSLGGTDGFTYSAAKIIEDPYTGRPTVIVPAINPDVALIHVHQADVYGNARIFGTGISHVEAAMASRKVVLSAEQIIETEEIRRDPGRTAIPYYAVDAVVHQPFGAYPGEVQGLYSSDVAHVVEVVGAAMRGALEQYLEKWVFSMGSHEEMMDKMVGYAKIADMIRRATIKEGYSA